MGAHLVDTTDALNDENDYERGMREVRTRIVARLRSRATSERGIEGGYTVDADPAKAARVRERFGMSPASGDSSEPGGKHG